MNAPYGASWFEWVSAPATTAIETAGWYTFVGQKNTRPIISSAITPRPQEASGMSA